MTSNEELALDDSALDDLDILLGFDKLGQKPKHIQKSPNEVLFSIIQGNGFIYWLRSQVLQFEFLRDDGIAICRESVQNNVRGNHPIKTASLVKTLVEYYLLSTFATRFDPARGLDKSLLCSLPEMTEKLLSMEHVQQIIAGTFKSTVQKYLEHVPKKLAEKIE